ncbi:MAG: hypothetical protein AAGH99_12105 [Planctomycetota bacterium]
MTAITTLQPASRHPLTATRHTWQPDGWGFRGTTTTLALAVSGIYGLLFAEQFGIPGAATLIGAGIAWPLLLAAVWLRSEPAWRLARLDWCLWTMTVGSVVMAFGLLATTIAIPLGMNPLATLAGGLLAADIAMGLAFTRYAPALSVRCRTALLIWVLGMNGFLFGVVTLAAWLERIV